MSVFERAWNAREKLGEFARLETLRVFHGPGEGEGDTLDYAIDRFGANYWVTHWGSEASPTLLGEIVKFLTLKNASSIVLLDRPEREVPEFPKLLLGENKPAGFLTREGEANFRIRFHESRHPGLFLDHEPLRGWLKAHAGNLTVLNTFSYTGSLSVAAGLGGARFVTTLDLSRPTIEWATENWNLNGLDPKAADFIYGDYFEWLPKFKKKNKKFDLIVLDPPSFSRGKKGNFSTSRDLKKLHLLALELLAEDGLLVSSINSANVSRDFFIAQIDEAVRELKMNFKPVLQIALPEKTFPTRQPQDSYLKGVILKRQD